MGHCEGTGKARGKGRVQKNSGFCSHLWHKSPLVPLGETTALCLSFTKMGRITCSQLWGCCEDKFIHVGEVLVDYTDEKPQLTVQGVRGCEEGAF